jgi:hypothetical protein
MEIQIPHPDDAPYTDADVAAIIAAPDLPMFTNMNPFFEARLQRLAAIETQAQGGDWKESGGKIILADSQPASEGSTGRPNGAGTWTWELAQIFSQCFRQEHGEPFVSFYREASRRLIASEYVREKDFDLSYLLFKTKQGQPEELSSETILHTLVQQQERLNP